MKWEWDASPRNECFQKKTQRMFFHNFVMKNLSFLSSHEDFFKTSQSQDCKKRTIIFIVLVN